MRNHNEDAKSAVNVGSSDHTDFLLGTGGQSRTFVTFDIAEQTFGVEVSHVREILDHIEIARIPNIRPDIEGIIDVRGESVPIMDFGSRLGIQSFETGEDTRIIIFEIQTSDKARPIGILADRVRDVTQIPATQIEQPPGTMDDDDIWKALAGLARHKGLFIALLDIDSLLGADPDVH